MKTERFQFEHTPISELLVVIESPITDRRGYFSRTYCEREFAEAGLRSSISQINTSVTRLKGTVRGLHFQCPPHSETKLVSCRRGKIFDVALDIRRNSSTFLNWFGIELNDRESKSLLIPPGFAHGFQSLTDDAEVLYLVTSEYSNLAEDGLNPLDPSINLSWPLEISLISQKDSERPFIKENYCGIITDLAD